MEKLDWYKISNKEINSLPEGSGLYIFSVLLKNQEYGVFYVGQSLNIRTRVAQHFSDSEPNDKLRNFLKKNFTFKISYARCREGLLDKLEKYLIKHYSPVFNNQDGNGNVIESCTLPNVIVWKYNC